MLAAIGLVAVSGCCTGRLFDACQNVALEALGDRTAIRVFLLPALSRLLAISAPPGRGQSASALSSDYENIMTICSAKKL